jgi:murein DD-endopeptidase MepM/ murein hydrolase activator NlpD
MGIERLLGLKRNHQETKNYIKQNKMILPLQVPPGGSSFEAWVNWNGFYWLGGRRNHLAFDFAAFKTKGGIIELGIPEWTVVAAESGKVGIVDSYEDEPDLNYCAVVRLDHKNGVKTFYHHVVPEAHLELGQWVKRGEPIGKVFSAEDVIPHLHFEIRDLEDPKVYIDPVVVFKRENLSRYTAEPQGSPIFFVDQLPGATIRYNFSAWEELFE